MLEQVVVVDEVPVAREVLQVGEVVAVVSHRHQLVVAPASTARRSLQCPINAV